MRAASALAFIAILPFLAGCIDGADPPGARPGSDPGSPGLTPAELRAGGFYAFRHDGGSLTFTLGEEGDASFDLFDGRDHRLGSVGFSSSPSGSSLHTIEGVEPGDLVLRLLTINGTLRVESDGRSVTSFRPLGVSVERHILVDLDPRPNPIPGIVVPLPTSDGYSGTVDVQFRRAPVQLRVLATGPDAGLVVEVRSDKGVVLVADGDSASPQTAIGELVLYPIPGEATPQNIRDGSFRVTVTADDLAGAVVLEAQSYSRAPLPAAPNAGPSPEDVPFTYGALPRGSPVGFTVHDDARSVYLWQEDASAGNGTVALFDADDVRIATVVVPDGGSVAVAVQGPGEFVAVLLDGDATLGADVAPADFDLHPLERSVTVLPVEVAGEYGAPEGGRYGQGMEEASLPTAYALRANRTSSGQGGELDVRQVNPFCGNDHRGRYLRVDQSGETVLAHLEGLVDADDEGQAFQAGTLALGQGSLQVHHDGFGADGCQRPVVDVLSYVRP